MVEQPSSVGSELRGVFAAMVTPMSADLEVDYEAMARFTEHLIGQGVHGLVPLGSTGEFYALDPRERRQVLEVVLKTAGGRVPVVPGANAGSTRDVIAHSRHAEQAGASGIMLAAPYYALPTPEELWEHFRAVNDAIGIPIMLYNYPGRTGVDMSPDFIVRLASLSNVRYVKESTGEMARITTLNRLCGDRLGIFCGCDTIAYESFLVGAAGWVGGVVNPLPRSHVRLYELAALQKDYAAARRLFERMLPVLELMEGGGKYTQFAKAACELGGHPAGPPRGPLQPATPAERARLQQAMELLERPW